MRSAASKRLNQGMVYRLHLYKPEQQLIILDELASVGFKVLYEMPQMGNCNGSAIPDAETSCLLLRDKSSAGYQLLNDTISLIKDHPALLGYCELLRCHQKLTCSSNTLSLCTCDRHLRRLLQVYIDPRE